MASSTISKSSYHPQSTFLTLFQLAYNRIWKSRALKFWEMFFWLFFATWLAFAMNGYQLKITSVFPFDLSRILIVILTPLLISVWISISHISLGVKDDPLWIVPLNPFAILVPRMLTVWITWLQFFLPLLLFFLIAPMLREIPNVWVDNYSRSLYLPATLGLIGWMFFWAGWGFMIASSPLIRESKSQISYYFLYFTPFIVGTFLGSWSGNKFDPARLLDLSGSPILPGWLISTGMVGIFVLLPFTVIAAQGWRVRAR